MLLPLVLQVQITLKSKTQQRRPRHHNLWHSVCRALIASCDTVFICFWIGTEWWRGHFGSGQAEGATESASQRRDLILARRETLEFTIGRSHLHSLPDLSCWGRLLGKRYTSNFWEKALRSLHWRFGMFWPAKCCRPLFDENLSSKICDGMLKLQAPCQRFQSPRRRAEWSSCSSHSPGAGKCQGWVE